MNNIALILLFNPISLSFNLPPGLLTSLCYVESHHTAEAVHHDDGDSDSLGICQIKLSTARLMGFKGTVKQLMRPDVNVYFAGKYLSHQIARYKGNVVKAVIAYNMGSAKTFTHSKYSDKVIKQWRMTFNEVHRSDNKWQ